MFQSTDAYCASLAHKVNHSFNPNAKFDVFNHPKFGLIPSVRTTMDLSEDEEVIKTIASTLQLFDFRFLFLMDTNGMKHRNGTKRHGKRARSGERKSKTKG